MTHGKKNKISPVVGLLGKNGLVTQEIARDLISLDLGRKVGTTSDYARRFRVGQGTVQKALKTLENMGAIVLKTRGHLGTYLAERDLGLLWAISGLETVTGVLPLPNSKEFEGIATALSELFADQDIPLNLLHLNGSLRRMEQLRSGGADFAVLSRFSADHERAKDPSIEVLLTCEPHSYYARDSLTVLTTVGMKDRTDAVERVGIDATSRDHAEITHLEFDSGRVEFVQAPYHLIPDLILGEEIEAAVWHKTTRRVEAISRDLCFLPLRSDASRTLSDALSRLALVTMKDNEAIRSLFSLVVDSARIVEIQNEVIEGTKAPSF